MRFRSYTFVLCLVFFAGLVSAQDASLQKGRVLSARQDAAVAEENRKHCNELGFPQSLGDNRCFTFYPNDLMTAGMGFSDGRAKVTVNGKAGFIDSTGKLVIKADLNDAGRFSEGLAPFEDRKGKWGFIDKNGQVVIPAQFEWALTFSEGLAAVQLGSKWGFIDRNGLLVIKATFDDVSSFSEGLAAVNWPKDLNREKSAYRFSSGFIDRTGNVVISGSFDGISRDFDGGMALVSRRVKCAFTSCSETFAIDRNGARLWTLNSWYISWFSDDSIVIAAGKDKNGKELYSALGRDGKPLFEEKFSRIEGFVDGLAPARKTWTGKYGFIDKRGQFVIADIYSSARTFSEGLAAVEIDSTYGYIDPTGKVVIKPQFAFADHFREGIALVAPSGKGRETTGYIDRSGTYIWKPTK